MLNFFLVFLIGLALALILGFPILFLCKKFHISQTILHYVDKHMGKSGTPTMGGWIFILPACIAPFFFFKDQLYNSVLILLVFLGYGLLGFMDDFIKIRGHKNEGLKPYQKIIGQVGLSLIIAFFTYFKLGSTLNLFGLEIDLGIFIIPFILFFYVAVTNSVNLTDGLDGLAGGVSFVFLLVFGIILALISGFYNYAIISFALAGAILGFLLFNGFPAKIFMGDTGSLALGGVIASLCVFSGLELILPIMGIMFVLSAVSDILQVAYYKKTHKRIFKMAPLHHHFEKSGVHENRIVLCYMVVTLVCSICVLIGYLAVAHLI